MPTPTSNPPAGEGPSAAGYWHVSRSTWYSFWFVLPLLLLYEGLLFFLRAQGSQIMNGADAILRMLLRPLFDLFGVYGPAAIGLVVIAVGLVLLFTRDPAVRAKGLQPRYFLFMAGESLIYALLLGSVVVVLMRYFSLGFLSTQTSALQMGGPSSLSWVQAFMLSLGAGVFEELVFRALLMGGIVWFCLRVLDFSHLVALVLGVVLSSFVFSAFHYVGALGDLFTFESFFFRFWAGACLAVIYGVRGFGIVVWTHALYDLTIFFGQGLLR